MYLFSPDQFKQGDTTNYVDDLTLHETFDF